MRPRVANAKFILARAGEEDIVLSGSANMSLSGLCSTAASGNVEVGNLLSGPPGSFDYLLDGLTIGPPADDAAALPVTLRPDHGPQPDQVTLRSGPDLGAGEALNIPAEAPPRSLRASPHDRFAGVPPVEDDSGGQVLKGEGVRACR